MRIDTKTLNFWAKARPAEPGPLMHPIVGHSIDVAAVAILLPRPRGFLLSGQLVGFLASLHDIGKFSRNFQAKVPEHWPSKSLGNLTTGGFPVGPSHDALGNHILRHDLASHLDHVFPPRLDGSSAWVGAERAAILRALAGHHGRPPETLDNLGAGAFCASCLTAAEEFIAAMSSIFQPTPLPLLSEREIAKLGWHLSGLVTAADWIGSRQAWFPYVAPEAVADPAKYLSDHATPRAAAAIAAAGLSPSKHSKFLGIKGLFPKIESPSSVQRWAETVELPSGRGPVLAIIEDLTGSGKTEAAVTMAHRLLSTDRGSGVFLALPTMATANAMFGRLADAYRGLFSAEANPSLALAHGKAALDPRFTGTIPTDEPSMEPGSADPADIPAESHCAAWLAQDGRRALLAHVGVGTLDQALMAVLPVRHATLRMYGLAGKVLIIDEVHAYDAYMQRELLTLLEFHAALGGSVILLSATLPKAIRQGMVNAFQKGLQAKAVTLKSDEYPLTTMVSAGSILETRCDPRPGLARTVAIERLEAPENALDRISAAFEAGAAVAWIRNTVDDAIAAADTLRDLGFKPILFHARMALADRIAVENEVLRRFGRDSGGQDRQGIVVATQVIEQSLDLDFDLLVTDLAPVDLLIQRAGRLWRHTDRQLRPIAGPLMFILSPDPISEPDKDWIKLKVYRDPSLLWRSARVVFRNGEIQTPSDMRPMIEAAYDGTAPGSVPTGLLSDTNKAIGRNQSATGVARQNVLRFEPSYSRGAGLWGAENHISTRLEDNPKMTLRLAIMREGRVVPYISDPNIMRAWSLSEVTVSLRKIASCPSPEGLQADLDLAKSCWGTFERESERMAIALMIHDGDGYSFSAQNQAGERVNVRYHPSRGLSLH
jgi:CRISPR-associated endonuclease/helicase Cas3